MRVEAQGPFVLRTAIVACALGAALAGCDGDPTRPAHGRRPPEPDPPAVYFTRDVLPILEARCFSCHGPDEATREGELRLDTRLHATARRLGGHRAVEPGSPDRSSLVTTIESDDPDVRMPPDDRLSAAERYTLRQWVSQGAPYAEHWAYDVPARPALPAGSAHPVDAFVDATLARVGFAASAPASPEIQFRRLALVLTGLPPTLAELDAFLADPSDAAYEAAVDRMLASDRAAEHLGRDWLDHVGYSDSNGMYMDVERTMWAYREWVIDAFRRNEPLDRFVTLQLAGDLSPSPSTDDRLATGFLRLHRNTEEGGIHADEFRALYASERAVMTANAMLGSTMQCARCHDHKYDPFTDEDFYRLTACFDRVNDFPFGGVAPLVPERPGDLGATLTAMGPLQRVELGRTRAALGAARAALAAIDRTADLAAWETTLGAVTFQAPSIAAVVSAEGSAVTASGGTLTATGASPHVDTWDVVIDGPAHITAIRLSGASPRGIPPVHLSEIGARVEGRDVRRTVALIARGIVDADRLVDGSTSQGVTEPSGVIELVLAGAVDLTGDEALHLRIDQRQGNGSTLGGITIAVSGDAAATLDDGLRAIVATPAASRSAAEREALAAHHARVAGSAEVRALAGEIARAERLEGSLSVPPITRVMADDAPDRVTHVLRRGDFYSPGEEVTCGIPASLADGGDPRRADRAALAAWMVSEANPLTARVLANRLFQLVFGRGIVATTQDFGTRGAIPSHPELLDWLATELVASGWDARHLVRLLVTSAAFRRSSSARPDVADVDPQNELLARGPRRRLDAEVLRDQALLLAGLLVERLGGPSVRPYQPPGLYEQLIDFPDHPMRTYRPDRATDRIHRRGVYTFWRRGTLLPSLLLLDAPDRMTPVARREATITPTQALALANEPLFVEAARAMAERARRERPGDVDGQITDAFRRATARAPEAEELALLRAQYDDELALARVDPSALGALAIGEADRDSGGDAPAHAALTAVMRTILTLVETITQE